MLVDCHTFASKLDTWPVLHRSTEPQMFRALCAKLFMLINGQAKTELSFALELS